MTHAEQIKMTLANNYEMTRGQLAQKTGLNRDQLRKALLPLLKSGEVSRNIDDQGVEWLTEGNGEAMPELSVEDSLGRQVEEGLKEIEDFSMERWNRGYKCGYEAAWEDVGMAIAKYLRKTLEIQPIEEQLND